ncbi:MAG TPA: shikimate dehydrogenase [Pyrinomonadaceae bacterium]|nr:shikimate dehydrogenase [Pyrinomonadaceae bacterium]
MTAKQHARLCVPVCVRRAGELRETVERAAELADLLELRLDCLEGEAELERAMHVELPPLFRARTRPFILTFRSAAQGGLQTSDSERQTSSIESQPSDIERRVTFWAETFAPGHELADYADLELDLAEFLHTEETRRAAPLVNWNKIICSYHEFAALPHDLETIYARMLRTPARILKIAVRAQDITDCLPVLSLLERARRAGRDMIAVSMGEAGLLTRILAPARGAFLTYGALAPDTTTAPGQINARDLRTLYRVPQIDERTQIMGLVGSPVSHSFSPHMHNAAFAARGLNTVYIPFETADVHSFIRRMAHPRTRELDWNLLGLSITAPHKSAVMSELDFVEPAAKEIGAVNTVVVENDALCGYNTDAQAALLPLAGRIHLSGARVAVLGAGGAARAVLWSLREAGARTLLYARDTERARKTAATFDAECRALDADALFAGFDLVVNATPLGTRGALETETPANAAQLRDARSAYDLVYNPGETRFMREARAAGCNVILGGLPMLVAQAAAQFKLWTGTDAPLELMQAAAEQQMSKAEARD